MKRICLLLGLVAALGALAATRTITRESEIPAKFGADRIIYDGSTATHENAIEFAPNGNAATIEVNKPGAALTLKGALTRTGSAAFVKNGPGTLLWCTTANNVGFNSNKNYYGGLRKVDWNEDGSLKDTPASTYGWCEFIVADGTFVFDSPGMLLDGYNTSVGTSSCTVQPIFIVSNGTFKSMNTFGTNWGRDSNPDKPAIVRIAKGGKIETNTLWANWNHGLAAKTLLEIDGGAFVNQQKGQTTQSASGGTLAVTVKNGGVYAYDYSRAGAYNHYGTQNFNDHEVALIIDGGTSVDVSGESTLRATAFGMTGGSLTVSGGSEVKIDRHDYREVRGNVKGGDVVLDGATVQPYNANIAAEWFVNAKSLTIGAAGVTATMANEAYFGAELTGPGKVTKQGAGVLALQPSASDVDVREGAVSFSIPASVDPTTCRGTVTVHEDAAVVAAGSGALGSMTVNLDGGTLAIRPSDGVTLAQLNSTYNFVRAAQPRGDGWIRLSEPTINGNTNVVGNIWQKTKMDISKSFTVDFDYVVYRLKPEISDGYLPYGFSVGWQNVDSNASAAPSGTSRQNGWSSSWTDSFAFGYDAPDASMHYTDKGGYTIEGGGYDPARSVKVTGSANGTFRHPAHGHVVYNAATHELSMTLTHLAKSGTIVTTNNLTETLGGTEAWFGFGGGGAGNVVEGALGSHLVSNVRVSYAANSSVVTDLGGTVKVPAGKSLEIEVESSERQEGWTIGTLSYGEGADIRIDGDSVSKVGFRKYEGPGALGKTGSGNLWIPGVGYAFTGDLDVREGGIQLDGLASTATLVQDSEHWQMNQYATHKAGGDHTPYTWEEYVQAHGANHLGRFLADGFVIGRDKLTHNKGSDSDDRYVAMINSLGKIPVDRSFRMTFDVKMNISTLSGLYGFYNLTFHNDPRGADTIGTVQYDHSNALGGSYGVANSASIVWSLGKSDASGGYDNRVGVADGTKGKTGVTWTSTLPVHMGHTAAEVGYGGNHNWETNGVYTLTYDPDHHKMHVKMEQMANGALQTFETDLTINIEKMVGATEAYLGFGCSHCTDWYGFGFTISNLKYEDLADDVGPFVTGTLSLGPGTHEIQFGSVAGKKVVLADVIVADDGAILQYKGEMTARTVTCRGMLTIDGGVFEIDEHTLDGVKKINLKGGAKLKVPAGLKVTLNAVYKNGVRVEQGEYSDDFVTGGGTVVAGFPGIILMVE